MSSFTEPLDVRYNAQKNNWTILRDFEFHVGEYPSKRVIKINEGEVSDFSSTPWYARWLIPKSGEYNQATVVHDKMCRDFHENKCQWFYKNHRQRCDIFLEALTVLSVPKWKRLLMYWAVRLGGPK